MSQWYIKYVKLSDWGGFDFMLFLLTLILEFILVLFVLPLSLLLCYLLNFIGCFSSCSSHSSLVIFFNLQLELLLILLLPLVLLHCGGYRVWPSYIPLFFMYFQLSSHLMRQICGVIEGDSQLICKIFTFCYIRNWWKLKRG